MRDTNLLDELDKPSDEGNQTPIIETKPICWNISPSSHAECVSGNALVSRKTSGANMEILHNPNVTPQPSYGAWDGAGVGIPIPSPTHPLHLWIFVNTKTVYF